MMIENFNLIREFGNGNYQDCYDEIELSLREMHEVKSLKVYRTRRSRLKYLILGILSKIPILTRFLFSKQPKASASLSLLMGGDFSVLLPNILRSGNHYVYIYDAWPRFHHYIQARAELLQIKAIFFSSKKVTALFNHRGSKIKAHWIPEGINLTDYKALMAEDRTIDVLEFGRKYQIYHDRIADTLAANGYKHLYEQESGKLVFKGRNNFLDALSRSKISICIPSNITHPERAEEISSMTLRYLQSMASKCLIVGIMPDEMRELFDYLPIVEIDMNDAEAQIIEILQHYERYHPLIDRNYEVVKQQHVWKNRLADMINIINNYEH
ncbi:glycosyltransferase [Pedobacter agri]|uniref:glycosyltransferase n=1 Tax=Pedobacter agri TaxID=454586 RepID=UPI00292DDB19|nr:glycosyltransferase [Pedobacter agri]